VYLVPHGHDRLGLACHPLYIANLVRYRRTGTWGVKSFWRLDRHLVRSFLAELICHLIGDCLRLGAQVVLRIKKTSRISVKMRQRLRLKRVWQPGFGLSVAIRPGLAVRRHNRHCKRAFNFRLSAIDSRLSAFYFLSGYRLQTYDFLFRNSGSDAGQKHGFSANQPYVFPIGDDGLDLAIRPFHESKLSVGP
jgi:hypothetical protein